MASRNLAIATDTRSGLLKSAFDGSSLGIGKSSFVERRSLRLESRNYGISIRCSDMTAEHPRDARRPTASPNLSASTFSRSQDLSMNVDDTKSLVALIDQDSDFRSLTVEVMASRVQVLPFDSAKDFLNAPILESTGPRCIVLTLGNEEGETAGVEEEFLRWGRRIPIIAVSDVGDHLPTAIRASRMGARTLLRKPVGATELANCISTALEDHSRGLAIRKEHEALAARLRDLSSRESEVMELLIRARNSKEIACQLGIGIQTVFKHRSQVLRKIGARNDVELALTVMSFRIASEAPVGPLPPMSYAGGSFA